MPLSSNAPFNEFGQSMILRDIEQIYLSLNGAGVGSSGDGQTQDQAVAQTQDTGDSGGITDLSGLATIDYVDQLANELLDSIPTVTYPISIANGGTGAINDSDARKLLGLTFDNYVLFSTPGTSSWTVPSGVTRILVCVIGGGGCGDGSAGSWATSSGVSVVDGIVSGAGAAVIDVSFDVTPGESISYTVGAKGVYGVSNGGSSSITTVAPMVYALAGGGGNAIRGSTVGIGGVPSGIVTPIDRRAIAIGFTGQHGCSNGSVTIGAVAYRASGNVGAWANGIINTAGSNIPLYTGGGNWTSGAWDGAVAIFY